MSIKCIVAHKNYSRKGFFLIEFLVSLMIGALLVTTVGTCLVLFYGKAYAFNKKLHHEGNYISACMHLNRLLASSPSLLSLWERLAPHDLIWRSSTGARHRLLATPTALVYKYTTTPNHNIWATTVLVQVPTQSFSVNSSTTSPVCSFKPALTADRVVLINYSLYCVFSGYYYEGAVCI